MPARRLRTRRRQRATPPEDAQVSGEYCPDLDSPFRRLKESSIYSPSAEIAVLGCMMAQPEEVIDEVIAYLKKEHFYIPASQILFEVIVDLWEKRSAVDVVTVHNELEGRNLAVEVQSPGILAEILTGFATHLSVGSYIRIVWQKAIARRLQGVCLKIHAATDDNSIPPSELMDIAEQQIFDLTRAEVNIESDQFEPLVDGVVASVKQWAESQGSLRGLPTPFDRLNNFTTGINNEDVWVIGARPGVGKTAMSLTMVRELVRQQIDEEGVRQADGYPVQFFSLEMKREQLILRLMAMHASINMQSLRTGKITEQNSVDMEAAVADMKTWPLYIDDSRSLDIAQIRARARRAKRKYGIRCVFIDYMQLIRCNAVLKNKGTNREQEVAEISRNIKDMNRELGIPVVILAQLNRKEETVEPALHHLRESGSIEQDADCVCLIHDEKNPEHDGHVLNYSFILAKQRNGPTGKVPLDFLAWKLLFIEKRS
jgi:replicative DNA helicase